jgi:hypothetical protein
MNWNLCDYPLLQDNKGIIVMCMIISSLTKYAVSAYSTCLRGSCMRNESFKIHSLPLLLEWLIGLVVSIWICSWASEHKYLIYFGLLTSNKYNIGKITLTWGVKKLIIGSNRTWKFRQINLVQVNRSSW